VYKVLFEQWNHTALEYEYTEISVWETVSDAMRASAKLNAEMVETEENRTDGYFWCMKE
jgi:hypothetical protein